jgi:hypothetical protein
MSPVLSSSATNTVSARLSRFDQKNCGSTWTMFQAA